MGEQPDGMRRKRAEGFFERARLPILFGLSALLLLGIYYFFFAQRKYSYLTGRNFRFLATIGTQLEASLASQARQLRSVAEAENLPQARKNDVLMSELLKEIAPKYKNVVARDFQQGEAGVSAGQVSMELRNEPEETLVEAVYRLPEKGLALHGLIELKSIVAPLFDTRGAFDALLLANTNGEVIYRQGIQDLSVHQLGSLLDKSRVFPARRGEKEKDVKALLSSSSDYYPVEVNGREYRLFVKPVELPLRKPGARASGPNREQTWLICGLVPQKELVYESLAVSSALLFFLLGALLLAILSWPFLKLKLIGETQRVGLFDVLLLGLCCVLGVSVATLFVLDLQMFTDLEERSKKQAEDLAIKIEENLRAEIRAAYPVLTHLEEATLQVLTASEADLAKESPIGKKRREAVEGRKNLRGGVFSAAFFSYPLTQSFSLMGEDGRQFYKASTTRTVSPYLPLEERAYFKRSRANDVWDLRALEDPEEGGTGAVASPEPFFLESIVAWSSGNRMAILAKPVYWKHPGEKHPEGSGAKKKAVVATLSIPMISVIDPVLPPGFKFAVVDNEDEHGRVLFHSDPERNSTEDFLAETDHNRRLRSAIFARRAETMRIRYWGEDYFASVRPVQGLPWTVIALKDLTTLRAVNADWLSTTLLFLLLYSGALAALLVIVAVARPRYRAQWIWPDPGRLEDYVALGASYLLTLGGFVLASWALHGSAELLMVSVLTPALALVMAYAKLRKKTPGREMLASGAGCLLLAGLAAVLLSVLLEKPQSHLPAGLAFLLISLAFLVAIEAIPFRMKWILLPSEYGDSGRDRRSIHAAYCFCGVLLLLITAVLPTSGFFKTAHQIHSESYLRHGQLKLALEMKRRLARAQKVAAKTESPSRDCLLSEWLALEDDPLHPDCSLMTMAKGLDVYAQPFFATSIDLPITLSEREETPCKCEKSPETASLAGFLESFLPRSSEHAAEMRELLHTKASDCGWHWHDEKGGGMTLHSRDYPQGEIRLASTMNEPSRGSGLDQAEIFLAGKLSPKKVAYGFLFSLLLCLSLFLVRFTSRRVFLIDLLEPLWAERDETGPSTMGRNLFLVSKGKQWKEEVKKENFFWLHLKDLEDPEKGWPAIRPALVADERVILVEGFAERIGDRDFNRKKLEFLESLAAMKDRTVVVISSISPTRLLSREERAGQDQPMSSATMPRWKELLSSFTVYEEDLREVLKEASSTIRSKVLRDECGDNPRLTAIALELDDQVQHLSREQILEELGERAEGYYQTLWDSCSQEEEVVLEHLAEEGLVNEKSRRLIRRLMARGLVRRAPHFRLMNETFRRFVISSARRSEVLGLEKQAGPSAWDKLRGPFFFGLAASITFFFVTQEALLDGVIASLTGLTAGIPAVVKAFDWFGGDRPRLPRFGSAK